MGDASCDHFAVCIKFADVENAALARGLEYLCLAGVAWGANTYSSCDEHFPYQYGGSAVAGARDVQTVSRGEHARVGVKDFGGCQRRAGGIRTTGDEHLS